MKMIPFCKLFLLFILLLNIVFIVKSEQNATAPHSSNDWSQEKILSIALPVGFVVLLLIGIGLFLCCCRRREKKAYAKFMAEQTSDVELRGAEREERSKQRREQLNERTNNLKEKYGMNEESGSKKKKNKNKN
eukprot:Sdes_comp19332_c0_seq2m10505